MNQKRIKFISDNQQVRGTLMRPNRKNGLCPAIIFLHGWTSKEDGYIKRAQPIVKLGYVCLTISLRGHGRSDGKLEDYSRKDHINDILEAYKFLKKKDFVDDNKISLVGKSYSGYLSAFVASQLDLQSLVLSAPALYPDMYFNKSTYQLIKQDAKIFRQTNLTIKTSIALNNFRKFPRRKLLVTSEKDKEVPSQTTNCYYNACEGQKNFFCKTIRNADHALTKVKWDKAFIKILINHFTVL